MTTCSGYVVVGSTSLIDTVCETANTPHAANHSFLEYCIHVDVLGFLLGVPLMPLDGYIESGLIIWQLVNINRYYVVTANFCSDIVSCLSNFGTPKCLHDRWLVRTNLYI